MFDPGNGQLYDMAEAKKVTLELNSNDQRKIRFLYGDMTFIQKNLIPDRFIVEDPYPNPFETSLNIPVYLPNKVDQKNIKVEIFNLSGKKVKTFIHIADIHSKQVIIWDGTCDSGSEMPAGIYIVQLNVNKIGQSMKLVFKR